MKTDLTKQQLSRLAQLRAELQSLEEKGMADTREWWAIFESIDSIEYNI